MPTLPDPYFLAVAMLAGKIAELLQRLRGERSRSDRTASRYFSDLVKAMETVLVALRERDIPRIAGHEMEGLLKAFPGKDQECLGR